MAYFYVLVIGMGLGSWYGEWIYRKTITMCRREDGVCGPEKINGKFFYLIPESLYCDKFIAKNRDED